MFKVSSCDHSFMLNYLKPKFKPDVQLDRPLVEQPKDSRKVMQSTIVTIVGRAQKSYKGTIKK